MVLFGAAVANRALGVDVHWLEARLHGFGIPKSRCLSTELSPESRHVLVQRRLGLAGGLSLRGRYTWGCTYVWTQTPGICIDEAKRQWWSGCKRICIPQ